MAQDFLVNFQRYVAVGVNESNQVEQSGVQIYLIISTSIKFYSNLICLLNEHILFIKFESYQI